MSAARSLERIATVLERAVPEHGPHPFMPGPFEGALVTAMVRSCPDLSLIREVPSEFFTVQAGAAVVSCPCGASLTCPAGLQGCGCDRVYLWDGRTLRAVRGAENRSCPCSTVKREHGGWVCADCGEAA